MIKHFILDTNVLLDDPEAIHKFHENVVVIPSVLLEEVDKFKKETSERGYNAREVDRKLHDLLLTDLISDVNEEGGKLKVLLINKSILDYVADNFVEYSNDNVIIASALKYMEENDNVILVSNDVNLRVRANILGCKTQEYKNNQVDKLYSGRSTIDLSADEIGKFYKSKSIEYIKNDLNPNQLVVCKDGQSSALGTYRYHKISLLGQQEVGKIKGLNKEQNFALKVLLDPTIKIVSLVGTAGSGKTLLALAAGLHQVLEEKRYEQMVVGRAIYEFGEKLGFLPGSLDEKMDPWLKPIYDNLEFILGQDEYKRQCKDSGYQEKNQKLYQYLFDQEYIQAEPLSYIRGRSIRNKFIIIDEAQNLSRVQIKTIITRAGHGSKVVLTGDVDQIDNPYVSRHSCGLANVANQLKFSDITAHVLFTKSERSDVAELAAKHL